ncbi:hypothetical protein ACFFUT_05270 [Pseudohalocynthiibacter aestuariivivens]|jgi:hypothetical protein|uniref:Uncharacterized protein n=1 Tax=Pseudohalocynthiibacter aestuariivivens TaxID=1591409 RepID=A0ABV5JCM0_9RHOB|nr:MULTISPECIES: hypothetical protein [Pseudohalocynthiibacter]MBS9717317.1 hypothetical protein [Pseudohalocynthiibacter aestuariivivens]MCK0104213.1 hypothetical protein [Pseudohalocynthiibacter sp. F2068]
MSDGKGDVLCHQVNGGFRRAFWISEGRKPGFEQRPLWCRPPRQKFGEQLPAQTRKDTLIIPDPNVRVQAVVDGQGIALNDAMVVRELEDG